MKRLLAILLLVPQPCLAQIQTKLPPDLRPLGFTVPAPVEGDQTFGSSCPFPQQLIDSQQYAADNSLSYRITSDRKITDMMILRSSGYPLLDAAAIRCVSGWHVDQSALVKFDAFTVDPSTLKVGLHKLRILWSRGCGAVPTAVWCGMPSPMLTSPKAVDAHSCNGPRGEEQSGAGSTTLVEFRISIDGHVTAPQIRRSSGNADFDQAAIDCVSTWVFEPATEDDTPYESRFSATIRW